ncbi:MAG: tRNA (N6-isopentenyl adenosine(37)-C2)-methylthiotransferase MiaB [Clostridia bacterium]|nr:tRNA (N6-isopentenyl adenosine(37)-C2)-methylthiotransferase MiaB [Clostridia bacterium]
MIFDINETEVQEYIRRVREKNEGLDRSIYVHTFGCQQNEADSERIRGLGVAMGYTVADSPDDASLIIVNTCAIRAHAEAKALSYLGRFKAQKRKNPSLIIGVAGCMAAEGHIADMLKTDSHYISFTVEPNMLHLIPRLVYDYMSEHRRSFVYGKDTGDISENIPAVRKSAHRAWVSVMYGCNNFCSYCIVPYVRGRERSRASAAVIAECRELISSGIREITLLGQNVNSYRSDIGFAELLEKIAEIEGDFRISFMTSHPKDASDDLIDVMSRYPDKIARTFHLPLQSGSDRVLALMNRTYDSSRYLSLVEKIRAKNPDVAITSDIIIGFPTESDEDFERTMDILRTVRFDMVYSFLYSAREGTRAAKMEGRVADEVKDARMARLLEMQTQISLEKNLEYVGRVVRVLVDSPSKRGEATTYTGRTSSGKAVHFDGADDLVGKFVDVKIDRAGAFDLFGNIYDKER